MTSGNPTLDLTVWMVYAGVMAGVLFSIINRINSHKLISRIISSGCNDRDLSKNIVELKLNKNLLIKSMLKPASPVMRYLKISNLDEISTDAASKIKKFWFKFAMGEKEHVSYPLEKASVYLPEDKRIGAELRFSGEKHPVLVFILAAVLLFAAACLALYIIPQLTATYSEII